MPRTRATKKPPKNTELELLLKLKEKFTNELEGLSDLNDFLLDIKGEYRISAQAAQNKLNTTVGNKTANELMILPQNWTNSCNSTYLDITKSKSTRKTRQRSGSYNDDGYLTADSTSSGGRKSRAVSRTTKTTRASRSLSKTITKKSDKILYKTPANQKTFNSFGLVTPKIKPNTPQVMLRRPQQGEIALSLQGSPLFTGNVVSDTVANVNIPLEDGRLFTLQPQRGLRISQIPTLAPEIQNQLEIIRDNLNKALATRN